MTHPPYPSYRDSGLPWLGQIPAHWEVKRLKHCVSEFVSGGTPESGSQDFWSEDEGGIYWVAIGDMTKGEIIRDTERKLTKEGLRSKNLRILPSSTLLYSMYASLGKVAILGIPAVTNQAILGVFPKSTLDNSFLKYWLRHIEANVFQISSSNTQDNLNANKVKNIPLFLPPLPEQRTIVAFLDCQTAKIDALIARKQRLLDLLAEQRSAIISHAMTKGLNLAVRMKDSGMPWLSEVPSHWGVDLVKRHFDIELGKMLDSSKQPENGFLKPYLRAANIYWEGAWLDDVNEMKFTKQQLKRYRLQKDDLLVTEGGVTVGRSTIWQGELEEVYYQNSINRGRPKGTLPVKFLYYWLYALKLTGFIDNVVSKATFGHLTKDKLELLQMTAPPMQEAELIVDFLDAKLLHITHVEEEIDDVIERLREYRSALISSAVTGKMDVREGV